MRSRVTIPLGWLALACLAAAFAHAQDTRRPSDIPTNLAPPVEEGPFIRPAPGDRSEPVWGLKDGIRVGLWPLPGPRGLLRIYAPYLDQPRHRVINFIAVEPIVDGPRGLSELEPSDRDDRRGKWFEPSNTRTGPARLPWSPPRGTLIPIEGGRPVLSVFFHVEPFRNGAHAVIQALFDPERPHEVELRTFAAPDSAAMKSCILTATMGNYARLRRLWLSDKVVNSREVWTPFEDVFMGFSPHAEWPAESMLSTGDEVIVACTTDEANPAEASYDASVARHWHYIGKPATQYWRAKRADGLVVRVNGRQTYWASRAPISGGTSFENFELDAPFRNGQAFRFGVTLTPPERLGFSPREDADPK